MQDRLTMDELRCLAVPLPEDVKKVKGFGDYALLDRLIGRYLESAHTPDALKRRLRLERIICAQIPREYPYTEEEAKKELEDKVGPISPEEWEELILSNQIDYIYLSGQRRVQDCFLSNLMKTRQDLKDRAVALGTVEKDPDGPNLLDETIRELREKGSLLASFRMRSTLNVQPEPGQEGRPVRVWLPLPRPYEQAENVRVLSCSMDNAFVARPDQTQRTVFMTGIPGRDVFQVEYAFDIRARYVRPEAGQVTRWQPDFYLHEEYPHIVFTPFLRDLAAQIVGEEKNPLEKARRIYDYITHHIRYSFMRAYITMPMITEFAAAGGKGDCGVQALLFITLCRICGVPARWQSGLYVEPGDVGCHDWAQFYVAPYGWLFCDCSFGGSAVRKNKPERWDFYFGNLDPFRMPANAEYQQEFDPAPRFLRYDPYDNQLGEVEYQDGPFPRGLRSMTHELLEVTGVDAVRGCAWSGQNRT